MHNNAQTVDEYIASLPEPRKKDISVVRELVRKHLPKGYEEGMQFGMIGYYVPLEKYPNTYNKQPLSYIAIASQKNYMSLYLTCVDGEHEAWLKDEFAKAGKKLDMGKSCLRFRALDDLPLDVIAKAVTLFTPEEFIAQYEQSRQK